MNNECLICKHHYTQYGGLCNENKPNCLHFIEEPKGKMIRATFKFYINGNAEIQIVKPHEKIVFTDSGKEFECEVIKINWVDMGKDMVCVDVRYHEKDMPKVEKKKLFKIISPKGEMK